MKTLNEAIKKAMDYLAIRDHSRSELRAKLMRLEFSPDDIESALDHAEMKGWLLPPKALAAKVAEELHRKKKSHEYIVQYLQQKELPPVPRDSERELEKALAAAEKLFSPLSNPSTLDKKQIMAFLQNRGFDQEIIQKVIDLKRITAEVDP
jgi:regulatory protein